MKINKKYVKLVVSKNGMCVFYHADESLFSSMHISFFDDVLPEGTYTRNGDDWALVEEFEIGEMVLVRNSPTHAWRVFFYCCERYGQHVVAKGRDLRGQSSMWMHCIKFDLSKVGTKGE